MGFFVGLALLSLLAFSAAYECGHYEYEFTSFATNELVDALPKEGLPSSRATLTKDTVLLYNLTGQLRMSVACLDKSLGLSHFVAKLVDLKMICPETSNKEECKEHAKVAAAASSQTFSFKQLVDGSFGEFAFAAEGKGAQVMQKKIAMTLSAPIRRNEHSFASTETDADSGVSYKAVFDVVSRNSSAGLGVSLVFNKRSSFKYTAHTRASDIRFGVDGLPVLRCSAATFEKAADASVASSASTADRFAMNAHAVADKSTKPSFIVITTFSVLTQLNGDESPLASCAACAAASDDRDASVNASATAFIERSQSVQEPLQDLEQKFDALISDVDRSSELETGDASADRTLLGTSAQARTYTSAREPLNDFRLLLSQIPAARVSMMGLAGQIGRLVGKIGSAENTLGTMPEDFKVCNSRWLDLFEIYGGKFEFGKCG